MTIRSLSVAARAGYRIYDRTDTTTSCARIRKTVLHFGYSIEHIVDAGAATLAGVYRNVCAG